MCITFVQFTWGYKQQRLDARRGGWPPCCTCSPTEAPKHTCIAATNTTEKRIICFPLKNERTHDECTPSTKTRIIYPVTQHMQTSVANRERRLVFQTALWCMRVWSEVQSTSAIECHHGQKRFMRAGSVKKSTLPPHSNAALILPFNQVLKAALECKVRRGCLLPIFLVSFAWFRWKPKQLWPLPPSLLIITTGKRPSMAYDVWHIRTVKRATGRPALRRRQDSLPQLAFVPFLIVPKKLYHIMTTTTATIAVSER